MNNMCRIVLILCLLIVFNACNSDKTNKESNNTVKKERKVLSVEEKNQVNSILAKAMATKELKTFVSMLVTAQLTEMLTKQKGPFTILAPTNEAFNKLPKEKLNTVLKQSNKELLVALLKSYIIEEKMDSASLVQTIKKNGGKITINSMSGDTLTASMKDSNIVIMDTKGTKAIIGKSDIIGSNGVLHTLDTVLGID